nr:MAG TPA: hypothetical protein [Caudoviricetes sp.]
MSHIISKITTTIIAMPFFIAFFRKQAFVVLVISQVSTYVHNSDIHSLAYQNQQILSRTNIHELL